MEDRAADIRKLIAGGESQRVEFKSTFQWNVRLKKKDEGLRYSVLKNIVAFLNTDGGTLLIGVEDNGNIYGIDADLALMSNSLDKFEQLIASQIKEYIGTQYTPLIHREVVEIDGKQVYVIRVDRASDAVYLRQKNKLEFYIRSGTTTSSLNPKETHEYIENHWRKGWPPPTEQRTKPQPQPSAEGLPFHTIAVPHLDIRQGRLTLDTFAADLWEVFHQRGATEYSDAQAFFDKTYTTRGLKTLLTVVEKRLRGQGGDPVIQMQTPFGGGKTHSLIALYHRAREWGMQVVVISGTPLSGQETLWGLMAEQLTGSRQGFEGHISPGRDAIKHLLGDHQPVLVLMDEVLEYVTKAAAVSVGQSTLAAQTLAFMQELSEAASMLEKVVLVLTLPSSTLEHYDEQSARFFEQLKKISGRVEKIFTPVQDDEVGPIIRRRLFSYVNKQEASQVIEAYVSQAERENLLSRGEESIAYRERFRKTYPFLPEVVDVLYHRWGSFPTFQRTRGTLRLLAMVVSALKGSSRPYLSLADFDLTNDDIRRELLKHIDNQYDSVLAADIVGPEARVSKVNAEIGESYAGLNLGERVATTIFMYSFIGGGGEAGATLDEIKRQNLRQKVPASVIAEVLQKLDNRWLFYLHEHNGRYYFSTTANLNRALTVRMESIAEPELAQAEESLLKKSLSNKKLQVILWPHSSADIPDNDAVKLIIMRQNDQPRMADYIAHKGQNPRVHRNTLFFLAPDDNMRPGFDKLLRRQIATASLLREKTLTLTEAQRQELKDKLKQIAGDLRGQIAHLYRLLYLPEREGLRQTDMGTPTYGVERPLDETIYAHLRREERLVERLAPLVIKERYLAKQDFIETRKLAESGSRTPGEVLLVDREKWKVSIAEGVRAGLFGLGEVDGGQPHCLYFKEYASVSLQGNEVLIRADICARQLAARKQPPAYRNSESPAGASVSEAAVMTLTSRPLVRATGKPAGQAVRRRVKLEFALPFGQVSSLLGLLTMLQRQFRRMEFTIHLQDGEISEADIEDKIRETFRQIGTDVKIE